MIDVPILGFSFEDYRKMIGEGIIVSGSVIVVCDNTSHISGPSYVVGTKCKLFAVEKGGAEVNPKVILSQNKAKYGWCVRDVQYGAIPETERINII